jgi:DNA (cytosine-5)-methyltransferase 1
MKKLKLVELYAGTGRSIEPFRKWRRAEPALLVDANDFCKQSYLQNFTGAPYAKRNLSQLSPRELLDLAGGRIDVLLGCPPCQGFSDIGLRQHDDPRNWHVRRFAHFAKVIRPLAVVMENVPRVAVSAEFNEMTTLLEREGYIWSAIIANSAQYGSCQTRQRLLFVAILADVRCSPVFPRPSHGGVRKLFSYSSRDYLLPNDNPVETLGLTPLTQRIAKLMPKDFATILGQRELNTVGEALSGLPRAGTQKGQSLQHIPWAHSRAMLRRMDRVPEGGRWKGGADHFAHTYGRLHRKGLSRTITNFLAYAGGGRLWHPTENRSLTLREAARIQGFPDSYIFPETSKRAAALVGNALDSSLASVCYGVVRSALE